MTRSARDALAEAVGKAELGDDFMERWGLGPADFESADRILSSLAEEQFALADLRTHVVVPREPTQKMQRHGAARMWEINKRDGVGTTGYLQAGEIYSAMLAAIDGKGK